MVIKFFHTHARSDLTGAGEPPYVRLFFKEGNVVPSRAQFERGAQSGKTGPYNADSLLFVLHRKNLLIKRRSGGRDRCICQRLSVNTVNQVQWAPLSLLKDAADVLAQYPQHQ